ncbi:hypothetical protein [Kitasatospora sp. NPDC087314]|uniref:hypothetical protein n=1 Tax=Kitasatospora sp. NPDC087314 TaxID=3364068 RepID=UPI00380417B1
MLLVDADGPLNPSAAKLYRHPDGYETHRLMTPRWEAAERRRIAQWDLPKKPVKPLRVRLDPAHGPALAGLPFDLAWEQEADTFLEPLLGLPALLVVACPIRVAQPDDGMFWKTPEIPACVRRASRSRGGTTEPHGRGPHLRPGTPPRSGAPPCRRSETGLTAEECALAARVCPECERADLHLAFTVPRSPSLNVMAALWCGACLCGIHLGNCPRPETGRVWSRDDTQRGRPVPDYTLIPWE